MHKPQKPLFPQLKQRKNPFLLEKFCGFLLSEKNLQEQEKRPTKFTKRFFQAKTFVKSQGVPFYQKRTVSKKAQCQKCPTTLENLLREISVPQD